MRSWIRRAFGSKGSRSTGSDATGTSFGRSVSLERDRLLAENEQLRADLGRRDDFLFEIRKISQTYEDYLAGLAPGSTNEREHGGPGPSASGPPDHAPSQRPEAALNPTTDEIS